MDLSTVDLIYKHYAPIELEIRKTFANLSKSQHFHFIDAIPEHLLQNDSNQLIVTDQSINRGLYPKKKILQLPDSVHGLYFIPEQVSDRDIKLDFNLFINRADVNRLFWFYKVIAQNWLNDGAISYIGSTTRSGRPDLNAQEFIDFLHQTYFYPMYEKCWQFARTQTPYQNFIDAGDLRYTMMSTKVSIVIECYLERADAISLSEKIFRAIQVPRPWVLSGATGSVARLRSMGFDVFDDYIDHSYDLHDTSVGLAKRDAEIFEQIQIIKNLKITKSILNDWNNRYQQNMILLASWHKTWRIDLENFIQQHLL